jgi:opacity protein-like surface antigen
MKFRKRTLQICFGLLFSSITLHAQTWEVGGSIGASGYMGDLNPNKPLKFSGIAAGVFVKANFDPYWGLGLHFTHGQITENDAKSSNEQFRVRNLNFDTQLDEVALQLDFNFLDYFSGGGRKRFTPYIFTGLGGVIFRPTATYVRPTAANDGSSQAVTFPTYQYQTEDQQYRYKTYAITIPYGAGVRYNLTQNWSLMSELGYRAAFTDYLDDVSKTYPSLADLQQHVPEPNTSINLANGFNIDRARSGTQRGDFHKRDTYMFLKFGLTYTFSSADCFIFSR